MENFLASRPAVAKLGSSMKNFSGGSFAPLLAKTAPAAGTPPPVIVGSLHPQANAPEAAAATPHTHAVQVEVIRENGVVQGIVVTCKCGERIELDCVY